jgi:rfaE bifunctional protein kinase chain/domain
MSQKLMGSREHAGGLMGSGSESVVTGVRARAGRDKRIAFVSGNFNIIHPGHLRLLQFAAECADFLVVGVNRDGAAGARLPEQMRLENVKAISLVDYAFLLNEPPEALIGRLQPAVVVKGKEYEKEDNPEQAAVDGYGGKLLFGSGEVRFSSLELLHREYAEATLSTVKLPLDFANRHGFTLDALVERLHLFKGLRVVVIGDLIVDEYIECDPLGMSQEDPTLVVTPLETMRFVGGAGIVAAHASGLGAEVDYVTVAGDDEAASFAAARLRDYGVRAAIVPDVSRPTTVKQRFRAAGKTLLRVSHLRQHDIEPALVDRLFEEIEPRIAAADLVVFSDFNYGCLPQVLVDRISEAASRHGATMVADSQASSQLSDVSRFTGMNLITPTEREARLALRDFNSGLAVVAVELKKKAAAENVVITLGSEGLLLHARNSVDWMDDRLPAFNSAPKDTAGAGDSFLACASMALCAGADIWQSVYLGSLAAACQVARVGNAPLSTSELIREIEQQ